MTMASSKDKVKRNNIAMGNLKLHRATAVCFIVTLLLLEQICTATSYQEAVIVFKKSCGVADVPNSKFYPDDEDTATSSFYRILEFHDNLGNNSHMFVGGKNSLTELRLNDLKLVREIGVPKYPTAFKCEQIQESEYYCQNYVTFLQEINSTTSILCGTNYLTPRCVMFQTATQDRELTGDQDWEAVGISASGPGQNAMTYIKVEGENMIMYSGAPTQIRYNYAFSRTIMGPDSTSVVVSTDTSVSTWIESSTSLDPSFIGQPIEYNGKIYFFFREEAVEARNVAKVVYSRVGQVCANDAGGTQDGAGKFTTFLKARLSCATAGDFQMSFDYLHGIFRSPQNPNIIFGAFTTPEYAFAASAICAYDLAEIEAVFATSAFKGQSTGSSLWLNVPNNDVPADPRPGECSAPQPISSYTKFQLMSKQVPNKADYSSPPRTVLDANSPPLILLQLYRFQKLVVQETMASGLAYDIFFLGTSEGQILKAYIYGETPRIVEEIRLDLDSGDEAINVLKISADGSRIFASTTSRVYSVPTENCQRFKTCAECVEGQDPACSWEATQGRQGCIASQDGIMDLENGSITECPVASSTPTLQTSPATPATDTTDQTPSLTGTTTGKDGQTPNSKTQTGTSNSSESMGTFSRPPPPDMSATTTTPSRLTFRTTPPLPQPTTTEYNPFNYTPMEPNSGQQLVCECDEGPRMELSICYPWILSSVLIVCCCNIPTCIALFLSCKKRKKNYSPSNMNRNRDASQKVPLHSMERLNSEIDEEADELSPMTQTDNGSPHRSINENSLHEKKNGQSSVPLRIPSTGTPVRGTTVSASEA